MCHARALSRARLPCHVAPPSSVEVAPPVPRRIRRKPAGCACCSGRVSSRNAGLPRSAAHAAGRGPDRSRNARARATGWRVRADAGVRAVSRPWSAPTAAARARSALSGSGRSSRRSRAPKKKRNAERHAPGEALLGQELVHEACALAAGRDEHVRKRRVHLERERFGDRLLGTAPTMVAERRVIGSAEAAEWRDPMSNLHPDMGSARRIHVKPGGDGLPLSPARARRAPLFGLHRAANGRALGRLWCERSACRPRKGSP